MKRSDSTRYLPSTISFTEALESEPTLSDFDLNLINESLELNCLIKIHLDSEVMYIFFVYLSNVNLKLQM